MAVLSQAQSDNRAQLQQAGGEEEELSATEQGSHSEVPQNVPREDEAGPQAIKANAKHLTQKPQVENSKSFMTLSNFAI